MKFGQGVYWGDGGWRAQIMAVGGKRVAGLGGFGEWVSGGRLTAGGGEVAGPGGPPPPRRCTADGRLREGRGPDMSGPYSSVMLLR